MPYYRYQLWFNWRGKEGFSARAYAFDCDKEGNIIDVQDMPRPEKEYYDKHYAKCLNGEYDVVRGEIEAIEYSYDVGICGRCGHEVALKGMSNICEGCHLVYDHKGNEIDREERLLAEAVEALFADDAK